MENEKQEKLKKILKKAVDIKKNSDLAIAREFVDLDEKIESEFDELEEKIESINESLKKKLESELVLEIDKEELKGKDGKDGKQGPKGEKGDTRIVEKVIEKREIIKEQPIVYKNITNEIKEVAKYEERDQIVTKINSGKDKDIKIEAKQITGLPEFTREVVREVGSVGHIETPLKAGSNISITTDSTGAKVISSTSSGGSSLAISVTFSELAEYKNDSKLSPSQLYLITDFKTKHNLYDGTTATSTVIEGSVEPLIVIAVSTSTIGANAYSTTYPNDTILFDSTSVLCEDGTTARTGKITYRKDDRGNETHYDFRGVQFRRWKFDLSGYDVFDYIAYVQGDIVNYNNALYYCVKGKTADDTPDFDTVYWKPIIDGDGYYAWQTASINISGDPVNELYLTIPVDETSYKDFYTFSNPAGLEKSSTFYLGFSLGKPDINIPYNNTVFNFVDQNKNNDNKIGTNHFNTILSEFQNNIIGNKFVENIGLGRFRENIIGNDCTGNIIGYTFDDNQIGNGFKWNRVESQFYDNVIGHYFNKNITGAYFEDNQIASGFNSNIVSDSFNENILNSANHNLFFDGSSIANIFVAQTAKTISAVTDSLSLGDLNLKTDLLTSERNIQVPNNSGTLALLSDGESFEVVSKNIKSYPYAFNKTGDVLDSITYTLPSGTITKTFNRTGTTLDTVVLSGDTPSGIDLTKTFNRVGGVLTSITYS